MIIQIISNGNVIIEKFNVPVPRIGEKIKNKNWLFSKTVYDVVYNYSKNIIEVYVD